MNIGPEGVYVEVTHHEPHDARTTGTEGDAMEGRGGFLPHTANNPPTPANGREVPE